VEAGWTEADTGEEIGVAGAAVTWLVTDDLQLDASLGRGIAGSAADWRWELGAAARF
jgi:hypothetical protein